MNASPNDPMSAVRRPIPTLAAYALSLTMVGVAAVGAVTLDRLIGAPNLSLVFVLPVVIAAASFGWGPALTAAIGGAVAFNFFLIEPRYTLRIADPANVWALVLLIISAGIVSAVAAQSRRRALQALGALDQASALQTLARALAGASDRAGIARAGAEALAALFGAPATILIEEADSLEAVATAGGTELSAADIEAAEWAHSARLPTRGQAYPVERSDFDFWPLVTPQHLRLVLGVAISGRAESRPQSPELLVETVGRYLTVALDREDLARRATEAQMQAAGEQVKSDLLAAVSHDLRTPLSTILVTIQSLRRFEAQHDAETRAELLSLAETETERLSGMVANLLDMNRIEAGALLVRADAVALNHLIEAALGQAATALAGHPVDVAPVTEAKLWVDPVLFGSALANVLENAAKYSPSGSAIHLRTGVDGNQGWIEVLDAGPGMPQPIESMFNKFTRGVEGDGRPPGVGLGLAIARRFLEAQGGQVEAANRDGGVGARVRLTAPLAAT